MSQRATMFSLLTSLRSSPARLATPIMPRFSLSFGEGLRACAPTPTSQAPVAAAVCWMNWRRFNEPLIIFDGAGTPETVVDSRVQTFSHGQGKGLWTEWLLQKTNFIRSVEIPLGQIQAVTAGSKDL